MRFGISTWLWMPRFTEDHIGLLYKIAGLGFDWVEFPLESINQFDYRRVRSALEDHGLGVSVTAVLKEDRDLTIDDPAKNTAALTYLRHSVDAVGALGGNRIGGGIYGGVGRVWYPASEQRARELERVARALRPIGQYAYDNGVVFGIETLIRFRSSFVNTLAEALELAVMIDSPGIQVMADTFHMNVEEDNLSAAIERAGAHLVHVHANETNRGAPGTGHLDWGGLRSALAKIGYDGALVIEAFGGEMKDRPGESMDMRKDKLAREGCAFLRDVFG